VAKPKRALGRGLDALIVEAEHSASEALSGGSKTGKTGVAGETGEINLAIDLLKPNPHQPRLSFDEKALQELADSIKENGILQPILAEEAGNGTYYIIAGERRTRAARLAGLTHVPVRIQKFSEAKKLEVALIENIQRENLNPLEEAKAYHKLMELANLNQEEAARRVGKQRSTVANALRLLKLPEDMQASLEDGSLTAGHARAVLSVINPLNRRTLFEKIRSASLSVREAEEEASFLNGEKEPAVKNKAAKKQDKREPDYIFLEQQLIEKLGTKVALKGNFDRGTITVEYFSRDDLDRLYNLFTGN